jgi:hypothetical protein
MLIGEISKSICSFKFSCIVLIFHIFDLIKSVNIKDCSAVSPATNQSFNIIILRCSTFLEISSADDSGLWITVTLSKAAFILL